MVALGQAAVVETAGAEDVVLEELVDVKLLVVEELLLVEKVLGDKDNVVVVVELLAIIEEEGE